MRVLFMLLATAAVCATYLLGRDLFGSRARRPRRRASALLAVHGFIQYASDGPREKTPDGALHRPRAVGGHAPAPVVRRRRLHEPGDALPPDGVLQHVHAVVVGVLLLASTAGSARWSGSRSVAWCPSRCSAPGSRWPGRCASRVDALLRHQPPLHRARPVRPPTSTRSGWTCRSAYGVTFWLLVAGVVALALVTLRRRGAARPGAPFPALAGAARDDGRPGRRAGLDPPGVRRVAGPVPGVPSRRSGSAPSSPSSSDGLACRSPGRRGGGARVPPRARADLLALDPGRRPRRPGRGDGRRAGELPADATITSIEAPQPLVLTGRTNPTRYQMFRSGLQDYLEDTWPGGRRRLRPRPRRATAPTSSRSGRRPR